MEEFIDIPCIHIFVKPKFCKEEILSKYGFTNYGEQFRIDATRYVITINLLDDESGGLLHINALTACSFTNTILPILYKMWKDKIIYYEESKEGVFYNGK